MKCQSCGSAEAYDGVQDVEMVYKGTTAVIHNVAGTHCRSCKNTAFTPEQSADFSRRAQAKRDELDAAWIVKHGISIPAQYAVARSQLFMCQKNGTKCDAVDELESAIAVYELTAPEFN